MWVEKPWDFTLVMVQITAQLPLGNWAQTPQCALASELWQPMAFKPHIFSSLLIKVWYYYKYNGNISSEVKKKRKEEKKLAIVFSSFVRMILNLLSAWNIIYFTIWERRFMNHRHTLLSSPQRGSQIWKTSVLIGFRQPLYLPMQPHPTSWGALFLDFSSIIEMSSYGHEKRTNNIMCLIAVGINWMFYDSCHLCWWLVWSPVLEVIS